MAQALNSLGDRLANVSHNRYTLTVDGLLSPISILDVESEALSNLLKMGQEKLSGLFTSITNYMHDCGFTFNSRYGNALYSAVCFGMKISANIVKSLLTSFIKFSDDLLRAIMKRVKMAADIVNSAYSKLSEKLQSAYKSHSLKLPMTRCLLGFQLFSIFRTWQSATSDKDKMTTAEMTSLWSGIMSAAMLTTKSFRCTAFVSSMVEKIKTKAFGAALSHSDKFKLLRNSAAGIMRVGNILGAIGSLLGALSQSEQKQYNSAGSVMKWVNIVNSILLTIDFACQAFVKQTLAKLLLRFAASSVICAFLGRLVAFMLHPLVGLAIFIITTVVALLSDNPLQSWFKSNRLGRNYYVWDDNRTFGYTLTNYSWAYKSYQDELNDLHEILDTDEYKAEQKRKEQRLLESNKEMYETRWDNLYKMPM